jgi:NAD(P)H dehydrogenase (quinone)
MPNVAVIYYSSTGTNAAVAQAVAEGAKSAGAEVRVRLVTETAPAGAIDSNPKWRAFVDAQKDQPSAMNAHGGQESTLLALFNSIYHFGGYIVTPGYTDPAVFASGGNPYGVSVTTGPEGKGPSDQDLAHARHLGKRVAEVAAKVR